MDNNQDAVISHLTKQGIDLPVAQRIRENGFPTNLVSDDDLVIATLREMRVDFSIRQDSYLFNSNGELIESFPDYIASACGSGIRSIKRQDATSLLAYDQNVHCVGDTAPSAQPVETPYDAFLEII